MIYYPITLSHVAIWPIETQYLPFTTTLRHIAMRECKLVNSFRKEYSDTYFSKRPSALKLNVEKK